MTHLLKNRLINNVLLVIAIAALIAGCSLKAGDLEKPAPENKPSGIPVDATVLRPAVMNDKLEVTGTILANQHVEIVSELTRKVLNVNVKEGSAVKQGDLLFRLDDADLQAQLERLHQQEKLAQLNEHRLKDLLDHDAIAQQDYDEASTNLRVLQAQIRELLVAIDKTRITAPFDGQIGMINIHVGAIVSVNTVLTDIEDNSVVKIEFTVPEKYTNVIHAGSQHTFTTPSSDEEFTTTVIAKAASLSTDTRTLLVRGRTPNPQAKLRAGQSARISLALNSSDNALAVSSQALIPSPGGYAVFVAEGNKAVPRPVQIGQRTSGSVEIVKGLNAGDTVITSNLLRLSPGAPVSFVSVN
ncbi:MAG TPA: efflux RND transporter periplasmic adaptor subunit [Chryseosolibacter sp.]|nr:efflux RND transporter periplasmic adaptor subunit [Chryseosolibacter sp.]